MQVKAPLSGRRRYWQAMLLANLVRQRKIRAWMAGETPYCDCVSDKDFIIRELERAYAAGVRDGRALAKEAGV
ncbi:hypothetical protein [Ancylobacter oerskovii]|uniref:Transposase n=1 Tax=Ancylobacter oerskovii TaxID=459519 RepID=A0ABW4Z166_9HYPH|nr:hypothetical protein [Ancylobacter oerskovii]MBS7545065.1 hypothetical protein [Ancylobacter oerskovii]